jgi:AcrR family transcriptional regulator
MHENIVLDYLCIACYSGKESENKPEVCGNMDVHVKKVVREDLAGQSTGAPDKRNDRIIDAAYVLLDEEGLEGLTIRAVLARTGLARRAFYDNFAGKDDLVLAVFEHTLRLAANYFAQEAANIAAPLDRLHLILTNIVLGRVANVANAGSKLAAALSREHLRLAEARPAELQRAIAPLLDLIAAQIADGQTAGAVRAGSPVRLSLFAYNLVSTTVHSALIAEETGQADIVKRQQLADEIWAFCQRGLTV